MVDKYERESLGSMTQFESITDKRARQFELSLPKLSQILQEHGLNVENIVVDPTRKHIGVFYADYDCPLYFPIFAGDDVDARIKAMGKRPVARAGDLLSTGEWLGFYGGHVPVPMMIYDFQRRYRDIPKDKLFAVWHGIYKKIDCSNGMWPSELLDEVFRYAPKSTLPEQGPDGFITLYRGMGELSQPPEKAFSWSTHPGNALWFANSHGCGTDVAVAKARPESIVAYFPGFENENEVILRPGSYVSLQYEDMIPIKKEKIPELFSSAMTDFLAYGPQAQRLGYPVESSPSQIHGVKHVLRVLFLSLLYFYNSGDFLNEVDKQILVYFSLLHDIGRTHEAVDPEHGEKAVAAIERRGLRIKGLCLTKREHWFVNELIRLHCRPDEEGAARIRSLPGLSRKDRERLLHLYDICKDVDGLDRVRFNGLDYRLLRTTYAKRLPLVAGCLLYEDLLGALSWNQRENQSPP